MVANSMTGGSAFLQRARINSTSIVSKTSSAVKSTTYMGTNRGEAQAEPVAYNDPKPTMRKPPSQSTRGVPYIVRQGRSLDKEIISLSLDKLKKQHGRSKSVEDIKLKRYIHQKILSNSFKASLVSASHIRLQVMSDFVQTNGPKSSSEIKRPQAMVHSSRKYQSERPPVEPIQMSHQEHDVSAMFSVKKLEMDNSSSPKMIQAFQFNFGDVTGSRELNVTSASTFKHGMSSGSRSQTERFRFNPILYEGQPMKTYLVRKLQLREVPQHDPQLAAGLGPQQDGNDPAANRQTEADNRRSPVQFKRPGGGAAAAFQAYPDHQDSKNTSAVFHRGIVASSSRGPVGPVSSASAQRLRSTASGTRLLQLPLRLHSQIRFCSGNEASGRTQEAFFERDSPGCYLFGLLDGLGEHGAAVVAVVAKLVDDLLKRGVRQILAAGLEEKIILAEFRILMNSVMAETAKLLTASEVDCSESGCTCLIGIIYNDFIVRALLGDVQMFAGAQTLTGYKVQSLAESHTITNKEEQSRLRRLIESRLEEDFSKDTVSDQNHSFELPKGMLQGAVQLPLTRALGFTSALGMGLTWVPEVKSFRMSKYDDFILIATQSSFKEWNPTQALTTIKDDFQRLGTLEKTADKLNQDFRMRIRSNVDQEDITFLLIRIER